MAYKGNPYQTKSCLLALDAMKDFLVACGWVLVGPTDTEAHRIAQDDPFAHILGWFLQSNGEDGAQDLHLHLYAADDYDSRGPQKTYNWLADDITISQTDNIPVYDATNFNAGGVYQINGELILVGTVDTGNDELNGCTRAYQSTTPAVHYQDDTIVEVWDGSSKYLRPYIMCYAFRDLENGIAESSGSVTWTLGAETNSGAISGLDGYKAETFSYGSMIKITDGSQAGKMRLILSDSAGIFTYTPFKTAPGGANVEIISYGHFPCTSCKQNVGTNSYYKAGSFYNFNSIGDVSFFAFGSKDGLGIMHLAGSEYRPLYFGRLHTLRDPNYTTMTSVSDGDIAAGTLTIKVANTDLFVADQKVKLLGQSYLDWSNNYDRSTDTYMGASPGDWPDLDVDEFAHENAVVQSVDAGSSTITLTLGTVYAYKAGAIIGEDPRPIGQTIYGNYSTRKDMLKASNWAFITPFMATPKDTMHTLAVNHRINWRCAFVNTLGISKDPWEGDGGGDAYNMLLECIPYLEINLTDAMNDNEERYSDALALVPFSVVFDYTSEYVAYNGYRCVKGILPIFSKMPNDLGSNSEDTIKIPWDNGYATFRIFYQASANLWVAAGPEIWP